MSVPRPLRARLSLAVGPAAIRTAPVLLVALPFLVLVLRECLRRPDYAYAGDEALIELDVRRVLHGDQFLGAYSRFGWRHPGPSWYTLLTPPYRLLGGHSWSLAVAVVLLSGLAAIGTVVVARRLGGTGPAVLTGLLVLLLARQLHVALLREPWNPVAVVLPTALFLLLAAAWLLGERAAGWTLVLGSVLVQTHIGTGVLVAAVVAVVAVVRAAVFVRRVRRAPAGTDPAPPRSRVRRLAAPTAFAGLLGLVWLGPVAQQLTESPGNLGLLRLFAARHPGRLPWQTAFEHLSVPLGSLGGRPLQLGVALPPSTVGPTVAVAGAGVLLLGLAWWRRSRPAAAVAVVTLTALVAGAQTIRQNVGPEYGYLVLWMTVLPVVLLLGYALLLGGLVQRPTVRRPVLHRTAPPALRLGLAGVAALSGLAVVFTAPPSTVFGARPARPQQRLDQLAVAAVGRERGPVLVRDDGERRWPQAAGIVLALRRVGVEAQVPPDAAVLFGPPYVTDRPARVTLQLLPVTGPPPPPGPGDLGCVLRQVPGVCLRILR